MDMGEQNGLQDVLMKRAMGGNTGIGGGVMPQAGGNTGGVMPSANTGISGGGILPGMPHPAAPPTSGFGGIMGQMRRRVPTGGILGGVMPPAGGNTGFGGGVLQAPPSGNTGFTGMGQAGGDLASVLGRRGQPQMLKTPFGEKQTDYLDKPDTM